MKILIMHGVPYRKVTYHEGIDHDRYDITYIGTKAKLEEIPVGLRCQKIERKDTGDLVEDVLSVIGNKKYDLLLTLSEFELLEAGRIRERLNIWGPKPDELLPFRDKIVMKEKVAREGVKVPKNVCLKDFAIYIRYDDRQAFIEFFGQEKVVLKPRVGASSEGVFICEDIDEVREVLRSFTSEMIEEYEIEEYVEGDIYHIDGLVHRGKVELLLASKYINKPVNFMLGEPLGSVQVVLSKSDREWLENCVLASGVKQGSFHLEVIRRNDQFVFLEIANRVGGGDIIEATRLTTGIHLCHAELQNYIRAYENKPSVPTPCTFDQNSREHHGWFIFPGHALNGKIENVLVPDKLLRSSSIKETFIASKGAIMSDSVSYQNWQVPFAGITQGTSLAMQSTIEELFNKTSIFTDCPSEVRQRIA